jgi:hypothetical protein
MFDYSLRASVAINIVDRSHMKLISHEYTNNFAAYSCIRGKSIVGLCASCGSLATNTRMFHPIRASVANKLADRLHMKLISHEYTNV